MTNREEHYWEQVPSDNQQVYRGLVRKLKIAIVLSAIVIAYLLYRAAA